MLALLLVALQAPAPPADPAARVACLGDSITFGAQVPSRERNSYPARLGQLLGGDWEVRNLGVGGRTLSRDGDTPYVETRQWEEALAFAPDVAVVMLGTNDTVEASRGNWSRATDLAGDARAMVVALREARPDVRVLLGVPPMFPEAPGLADARREGLRARAPRLAELAEAVRGVAAEFDRVEFLELDGVLRLGHVTDGVHTTSFGADALARHVLRAIEVPERDVHPAVRAAPSAEYRSGAGWGGGTWWDQLDALNALARAHPDAELVFLGDSITQGLTGAGDRVARADGAREVDRAFGARGALSLGLSGDRTEHLLWRIRHGALATLDPRVVVLQVGVNNVNAAEHSGEETLAGIAAVVAQLRAREPQADVVVCGPFPAGRAADDPRRAAIDRIHAGLPELTGERVHYLDLRPLFLDADGAANGNLSGDGIHVTGAGRAAWMEALAPLVDGLLDA